MSAGSGSSFLPRTRGPRTEGSEYEAKNEVVWLRPFCGTSGVSRGEVRAEVGRGARGPPRILTIVSLAEEDPAAVRGAVS